MVSDTRIYNDVLTPDEVTYLYTNGQSGTDPGKANLLAHYPLQEESGPTAYDIGPNGNHGTITNAVTSGVGSIHQPDADVTKSYPNDAGYSRRMVFDGVDDIIRLSSQVQLTGEFSLSLFVSLSAAAVSVLTGRKDNSNVSIVYLNTFNNLIVETNTASSSAYALGLSLNELTHVTVARNSSNLVSVYKNGSLVSSQTVTGTLEIGQFGARNGTITSLFFNGLLSDIRIYNDALTADEVTYLYTQGASGTDPGTGNLVAAYEGYGNTDADWVDTTGGCNDGVVNGSPIAPLIPAASPTLDALGGTLTETGRVPQYGTALGYGWQGNGSTVYVNLGEPIVPATADFTISFPYYHVANDTNRVAVIGRTTSSELRIQANGGGVTGEAGVLAIQIGLGTPIATISGLLEGWNFIEATRVGSNFTLSLNGDQATGTSASSLGTTNLVLMVFGTSTLANDGIVGPVTITTGGVTTSFHPIPGTRDVAKVVSNAEGSVISSAVVNGVLADLYTIGDGSWRLPHIENGAHWDGTALYPAGPGQANAVNGEAINIPANVAPRGLLTDRTGGVIAPLDYAMDTDTLTDETFDQGVAPAGKRFADNNYSDRYGAAVTDISENAYFEPRGFVASVGTSTSPTSTGTKAVTGVGFTPKLLMPFSSFAINQGSSTECVLTSGIASSTAQARVSVESRNLLTTTSTSRRHDNASVAGTAAAAAIPAHNAAYSAFDADGFTLDWSTVTGSARILNHIALGGTDIEVSLTQHQMNATNLPQSFAHGLSGAPTALLFFSTIDSNAPPSTSSQCFLTAGFYDGVSQVCSSATSINAQTTTVTNRLLATDSVIGFVSSGIRQRYMAVDSVDASNVNCSYPVTASSASRYFFMLAIRGAKAQVGTFD